MSDSPFKLAIRSLGLIALIGVWICLILSLYYGYKAGGRLTLLLMKGQPSPLADAMYIAERALQIKLLVRGLFFFTAFVIVKLIGAYFGAGFSKSRCIWSVVILVSIPLIFVTVHVLSHRTFTRYYEAAKEGQQETQEVAPQLLPGLEKHRQKEAIASEREEKTMLTGLASLLLVGAAGALFFKELESARNSNGEKK